MTTVSEIVDGRIPIRSATQRRALVEGVRDGAVLQETDWLEWKSRLPLDTSGGVVEVARQLIGFANRRCDAAARHCGGHGFVLVGVAWDSCPGTALMDTADLENRLRPFIGRQLRFDVHWVPIDGVHVLLFDIDPPTPGDDIFCLRQSTADVSGKQLLQGAIWIRRPGKTEPAGAADIDDLANRARQTGTRLDVGVRPVTPLRSVASALLTDAARAITIRDERARLLAALPQLDPHHGYPTIPGERRSREAYQAEVERWCASVEVAWPVYAATVLGDPSCLELEVTNRSEVFLEDCLLELLLELPRNQVHASMTAARTFLDVPMPPPIYGSQLASELEPTIVAGDGIEVAADGTGAKTRVSLGPFELRPRASAVLAFKPVALCFPDEPGRVDVEWRLTSRSTLGEQRYSFALRVDRG
jgi:hypothetical protein